MGNVKFKDSFSYAHYFARHPRVSLDLIKWRLARGDNTLRLNYELRVDSLVFDVGGYRGDWSELISRKYNCSIHIFEPVRAYSSRLRERFKDNPKLFIHQFGLSDRNYTGRISIMEDASSLFRSAGICEEIQLVKFSDFVKSNQISHIHLMKINIEGGEYELLEHMIESGFIRDVDDIQVQFHDFVPSARKRMNDIRNGISVTHSPSYSFDFIWENWRRKKDSR